MINLLKKKFPKIFKSDDVMPDEISPMAQIIKDSIAPAPVFIEGPKHIQMGSNFTRTFLVLDYPNYADGAFFSKLYRHKGNLTISTFYEPKPSGQYIKSTENSISELRTELEDGKFGNKESERLKKEDKLAAAQETLKKLVTDSTAQTILHIHMYLHLTTDSLEKLEAESKKLVSTCNHVGIRIEPAEYNMVKAFQSCLPTVDNKLPEMTFRNFDSVAASHLFPFDESELFMPGGIIKGLNKTTKGVVKVDQKALPSHNEFVVGQTGMGKTFYLVRDMIRKWQDGDQIFCIDPEGEISKICRRLGGQVIKVSPTARVRINIMEIKALSNTIDLDVDVDDYEDPNDIPRVPLLFQKIQSLKIFCKLILNELGVVELAQLEKALLATYASKDITHDTDFSKKKPKDFPILEDLYNEIDKKADQYDRLQNFKEVLYIYVKGSNSRMFNGHTNVDLKNDWICFDLKELEEESDSQAAAMYNTLSYLWDVITADHDKFIWLYIDECHTIADPDNPRAMKFVYQIYKRIRKYYGGCTVATQQIVDYLSAVEGSRNYGQAIIGNSISQLYLPLKQNDIADLLKNDVITLSEEEVKILSKLKQGQGIYVVGTKRVNIEVDFHAEELKAINPKHYAKLYGDSLGMHADEESVLALATGKTA